MLTRRLLSRRMTLYGIALVLALGATISSRRIQGASDTASGLSHSMTAVALSAPHPIQGKGDLIQTIRVFVHPEDLYPGSVLVKPGKIRLVAENQTQSDVSLVVERVNPGQAHQSVTTVRTVNHGRRTRQDVTLGAGEYVFYEESRPQQQGRIIVDPQVR